MKYTRHLLTVLLTTVTLLSSWAQGIIVNKTDGTQVIYQASEVESITTYSKNEEEGQIEAKLDTIITIQNVSFKMIYVEGGTFTMGATPEQSDELSSMDEQPIHEVWLSDYYIAETETTQELWEAVLGANYNTSGGIHAPKLPMQNFYLSGGDLSLAAFLKKLNEITHLNFSLPSEAQWEYAARGGKKTEQYRYAGGNNIELVAWTHETSSDVTHEVGQKEPNELGIYDMSGNVREWCNDYYDYAYYSDSPSVDPQGPKTGDRRVIRGGSYRFSESSCRIASRDHNEESYIYSDLGFRLVLNIKP